MEETTIAIRHARQQPMSNLADANDSGSPDRSALSRQSREVSAILLETGGAEAHGLFVSAHEVLTQQTNPRRERMCGYALRELLDELESQAGVARNGPGLGVRVDALRTVWERAERDEDDTIVDHRFTRAIDTFFDDHAADFPRRRQRAEMTIKGLDPAGPVEVPAVRSKQIERLMRLRDDLNKILHRGGDPKRVYSLLDETESFLLSWLRPRPFDDASEIDQFLREGPPSA